MSVRWWGGAAPEQSVRRCVSGSRPGRVVRIVVVAVSMLFARPALATPMLTGQIIGIVPALATSFTVTVQNRSPVSTIKGKVVSTPAGIDCTTGSLVGCSANLTGGVTFTASSVQNAKPSGWTGCTPSPDKMTCTTSVAAAKTVAVTFAQANYTLTARSVTSGGASVNLTSATTTPPVACDSAADPSCTLQQVQAATGSNVVVTATPDANTTVAWTGCASVSGNDCTVAMTAAKTVTATASPTAWPVSVALVGAGTVAATSIACPGDCSGTVPAAGSLDLTATAASGWSFVGWSNCSSVSGGVCTVQGSKAYLVTAAFEKASCNSCHGTPPPAPHAMSTDCGVCHAGYTAASVPPGMHMDGDIDGRRLTFRGWGANTFGEAVAPPSVREVKAVAAGYYHTVVVKNDGTVLAWGENNSGQTDVPASLSDTVAVAAGEYHTLALSRSGMVTGWGQGIHNKFGQAVVPTGLTDVVAIAAGSQHSVALKRDGTVVAWGNDEYGQATVPQSVNSVVAIAAGLRHTVALSSDGTVMAWGDNASGQTSVPVGLNDVVAIAAGAQHTVAVKANGTVVAWGDNTLGQTSVPLELDDVVQVSAGYEHTVALKTDGSLVAWGDNTDGQLTIPVGLADVIAIAASVHHTLALKVDGTIVGWGYSLGDETVPHAGVAGAVAIAAGRQHSIALNADGTVVAWGYISRGAPAMLDNVVAIAAAGQHTVALREDGTVFEWGYSQARVPRPPELSNVVAVAAGYWHTMALKGDGTVVAWGEGHYTSFGQAVVPSGLKDVTAVAAGYGHSVALKSDGTVVAWGYNQVGQADVPSGLSGVIAVAAGARHTVALTSSGAVVAWGDNEHGQATVPAGLTEVVAVAAGDSHTVALRRNGTVVAWGNNTYGQASVPAGLCRVVEIAAGAIHTIALTDCGAGETGSWAALKPLSQPRYGVGLAVANGMLYAVGGGGSDGGFVATTEVYDPAFDSWTALPPMPKPLMYLQASAVDGKIYAIGGYEYCGGYCPSASVQAFDLATNAWSFTAPLPLRSMEPVVASLDNKLYVLATDPSSTYYGEAWHYGCYTELYEYDVAGNSWNARPRVPVRHCGGSAGAAVDGKLYVFGGFNGEYAPNWAPTGETLVFDPTSNAWNVLHPMPTPRYGAEAVAVGDLIYVIGGFLGPLPGARTGVVEAYDVMTGNWRTEFPSMPTARDHFGAAAIGDGIHTVGGVVGPPSGGVGTDAHEVFVVP